jgi:HlyD family secretion protein
MKKNKKSRKPIWIALAVLALVLVVILMNFRNQAPTDAKTYTIEKGKIELLALATGKLTSSNEDRIKLNGSVTDTLVALGDVVSKGDILGEYTRQSSTNSLYAPVSGVVTEVPSALGSTLTIAGSNQFKMVIQLPETELKRVSLGQYAEVYVSAVDQTFYGSVTKINQVATIMGPQSTFGVTLSFDGDTTKVRVGMSAVSKMQLEGYGDYYVHGKLEAAQETRVTIDGSLTKVDVNVGDTVNKNQKLGEYQSSMKTNVKITATRDGIITSIPSGLSTGFVIADPDALELTVDITETDIHKLSIGQNADIYIEAIDRHFEGAIVKIAYVGNTNLDYTTYPVTIEFDEADASVFLGMSGSASIVTNTKENILIVPFEAIVTEGTQRYLVSAEWLDNSRRPQSEYYLPIETGLADAFYVEVIGEDLEGKEVLIIEKTSLFPIIGNQ